jgi:tRNA threonylcarbamoyladenosine biosynthesis protein TsaE
VREFRTASEEETIALGERLAALLPPAGAVLLIGNLGAGKTTLAKGLIKGLTGVSPHEVTSPTFTLIHEYGDRRKIYHIDLYRLDDAADAAPLGLDDLFAGGLCIVEWGERFPQIMPRHRIEITLEAESLEIRRIRVHQV